MALHSKRKPMHISKRIRPICIFLLIIALTTSAFATDTVDLVIVRKTERKMSLMSDGAVIKTYDISLGGSPKGHKIQQGDSRTPEGRYIIDYRNPNSRYHLSLHISYPDAEDRRRAKRKGVDPGGMIMIHGLPNNWTWETAPLKASDWTDGCIAVTNREIEEIWALVKDGTPIVIVP